ncbi:hypothetical protein AAFF_G00327080 [Aldrovandia affinis]|uniref:Elongator complex protein 5 n=1 Tax=Aldrovandia affinis TaxID=143900 RepID=A0AAD7T9G8_9TELE|nr:hypothetical protein AAFF_G00327080 [Aldrovandia affinis]
MLLDIMQTNEVGGLVIIQDTVDCCGRQLLKGFIHCALKRDEVVHVLGFEVCENEFRGGLDSKFTQGLYFHDGYTDPLGWTECPPLTVHHFTPQDINTCLSQSEQLKTVTLVVDSLSWILRHHSPAIVCQRLQELRRGGALRSVLLLLHSDMHQQGIVGSLCHLATAVILVAPGMSGQHTVAKTTRRTKSGRVTREEECFSVSEDLTITIEAQSSCSGKTLPEPEEYEADPAANLTFNLRLSEVEREAKEKLSLPFVFSQEKKSALLHPRPGAGRILYEPDDNDDFDQEDPDDDLDV